MENEKTISIMKWTAVGFLVAAILCQAGSISNTTMATLFKLCNITAVALLIGTVIHRNYQSNNKQIKFADTLLPYVGRCLQFVTYLVGFTWVTETLGEELRTTDLTEKFVTIYGTAKESILGFSTVGTGMVNDGIEETITSQISLTVWAIVIVAIWWAYKMLLLGLKNSADYDGVKKGSGSAIKAFIITLVCSAAIWGILEYLNPGIYVKAKTMALESREVAITIGAILLLIILGFRFHKGKTSVNND